MALTQSERVIASHAPVQAEASPPIIPTSESVNEHVVFTVSNPLTAGNEATSPVPAIISPTQEGKVRQQVFASERELHPLRPADVDWQQDWINRYGKAKGHWKQVAQDVTDSAVVDPEGFSEHLLSAAPDEQIRLVELLSLAVDGGEDISALAFARVLADLYQPDDEEGPLFEVRRRQFLNDATLPFPSDERGRRLLGNALGMFFHYAEGSPETQQAIRLDTNQGMAGLMWRLPKDTNTNLVTSNPDVFQALGGRRNPRLQRVIDLKQLPSTSMPDAPYRSKEA